jgi:uncharacterized membrane protein
MKKKFLNELNYELRLLKKKERIKCLNNYQEMLADKMETGMSESDAVADFGNVKQIAHEILTSYAEMEDVVIHRGLRTFHKMNMLIDMLILAFAYVVSCLIYYQESLSYDSHWPFPFLQYALVLLFLMPGYLILHAIFHLYRDSYIRNPWQEARKIILVNVIGIMLFGMVLYFIKNDYFARMVVFNFFLINTGLELIVRRFVSDGFSGLHVIEQGKRRF